MLLFRSYAKSLGCEGNETSEEMLKKLRLLPAAKLQVTLPRIITTFGRRL
jgi:hypothetical protein